MLDPEKRLVDLRLHNERTRARFLLESTIMFSLLLRRPDSFLQLVSRLQGNTSCTKKPASFASNTISFASSDVARKNDVMEDGSAKKEENAKPVTSPESAALKNPEAEKVPSKTTKPPANYRSTGAEPDASKTSSNTSSKTPKAPGSDTSRPGSNLTPSNPSFPSKNLAGEEATKKETTDKSLEKPAKNLDAAGFRLRPAEEAKADVKKKNQ